MSYRHSLLATAALAAVACSEPGAPTSPSPTPPSAAVVGAPGAVFTESNAPGPNEVIAFTRAADGSLRATGRHPTGGQGTGQGLGSQGAVVLSDDHQLLFVVNAGSDDISVFVVGPHGLELVEREPSGGDMPISLTIHKELLYVLNAGVPNNITGFRIADDGTLTPLAGSTRPLSGPMVAPAQVEFTPHGDFLVVTEKRTNLIDTYRVGRDGVPGVPFINRSHGLTPFGFAFDQKEHLIVSEAFEGAPDASAMSSYDVLDSGALHVLSGSVPTTETAACWVIVTNDGRFTYTTNTGSNSITAYIITPDGRLVRRDADGRTATTGSMPIDMALSAGSRFLYALNSGDGSISGYRVSSDGGLMPVATAGGLPIGSVTGLAAR
jgi:6-phosphogluconolactonase